MKLRTLVAATALGLMSLSAQAGPLSSVAGPVKFKMQGITTELGAGTYGNETTWGLGEVTQILNLSGDTLWSSGEGGYLYYMLYGIADQEIVATSETSNVGVPIGDPAPATPLGGSVSYLGQLAGQDFYAVTTPTGFSIENVGCTGGSCDGKIHLDVYNTSTAISGLLNLDPNTTRTAFNSFSVPSGPSVIGGGTAFDGVAAHTWLQMTFDPGISGLDPTVELLQDVDATTLPATGKGNFYASAVGGSAMTKFDTNGENGGLSDFFGSYTLGPNESNCTNAQDTTCFQGKIDDPIVGRALPEPGSMALVGLGLLGFAGLRRRKTA